MVQRPDFAINKFTRLMHSGEEIQMHGDGSTYGDYTFIDDIVDGMSKSCNYVMKHDSVYEILNIDSNNPSSLKKMIDIIGKTLNIEPKIKKPSMQPGDVDMAYASIDKARKLIGYYPKTTFAGGIKKIVDWYIKNKEENNL